MIKKHNVIYDAVVGKVYCKNCRNLLAVLQNPDMKLVLSVVCPCQTFCEIKIDKVKKETKSVALDVDGGIICRNCGKTLFEIEKSNIINFAFRAECDCGAVFEKTQKYRKPTRRLGEYAEKENKNDKTYCNVEI